ncbi:MAG: outer membrane protein assembly factor BamA [Thermodesulfobacteriota bacterium]
MQRAFHFAAKAMFCVNPACRILLAVLLGLTALEATAASSEKQPEVGSITVEIGGGPGDPEELERMARSMIYLEEKTPFSDSEFSRSVEALESSGLFEAIEIPDPDWSEDRIDLVFKLKPFARIKEINIHGAFPLLEKEIRNAMTINAGDPCIDEKLLQQEEKIESLFLREGYISPRVSVLPGKKRKSGHCTLDVSIEKGQYYQIRSLDVIGNTVFSDIRLKARLGAWQSSFLPGGASRLVQKKVEEDAKTLRRFYRKKGFPEAEVLTAIRKDEQDKTARVELTVSEGPEYIVEFEGNNEFWDFTLKKDLVFFTEGITGNIGLRKSIRNMQNRYRKAGYPDIQIRAEESDAGNPGRDAEKIKFIIREGPRYMVESVTFSDIDAFDEQTLRDQMLTAPPEFFHKGYYVPETLEEDIRAIQALYEEEGYRQASIEKTVDTRTSPESDETVEVSVKLEIGEGPQTIVDEVFLKGELPVPKDSAKQALEMKPGTPFRHYLVKPDRNSVAAAVSEKGYPHVSVEPEISFTKDGTGSEITYTVEPGPYVEMGDIFFTGNFKTRTKILDREVETPPGEPFSLSEMLETQRNIRGVQAVDTASFKTFGLEQKADRIDMLAEIREIRPYFVEFAAGYDTRRLFYMNAAAGDMNLLGLNKQLRANLEWSQIGYRAEIDLNEPRFFGTRITSGTNLFSEKTEELNKDFGTRIHGASQSFSRRLSRRVDGSLNFSLESRDQYRTDNQPVPEEETDEYERRSIATATPGLTYRSTDSYLRPKRGIRSSAKIDVSKGISNPIDDFFRYRLNAQYYYTPFKRLTLAFRGMVGHIDPYGSNDRAAEDQLFFLGGTADVRGFSENKLRVDENRDPVGGRTAVLASAEARFDLGMNFEGALFYDTGTIRNAVADAGSDDFRESAGVGLRYITPIGPIGGMYGWKLDRKSGESAGAFHFSIGYTF